MVGARPNTYAAKPRSGLKDQVRQFAEQGAVGDCLEILGDPKLLRSYVRELFLPGTYSTVATNIGLSVVKREAQS